MAKHVEESIEDVDRVFAERAMGAAHRPSVAVSGPYGHPLHPLFVTVPIGALVCTVAFDVASLTVEGRAFGRAASWLCLIGILSGVVAAVFGLIDSRRLVKGTRAHATAMQHMVLMASVLVLFIVSFLLRRADSTEYLDGTPVAAMVVAIVGLLLLAIGGWLGGKLVYSFGVRVVDEADQMPAYVLTGTDAGGDDDNEGGDA